MKILKQPKKEAVPKARAKFQKLKDDQKPDIGKFLAKKKLDIGKKLAAGDNTIINKIYFSQPTNLRMEQPI